MLSENTSTSADFFPALCASEAAASSPALRLESEEQASLVEALLADSREAALVLESHSGDLFDSRPIYVNPAYSRLTGQSTSDAARERPWFLSREAASAEMRARLRAALADGLPIQREPVGGCINSRRLQVLLSITPLTRQTSSLAPSRWLVTLRDLADSDRIDAELRKLSGRARCLIWHALVEDRKGQLVWNFRIPDAQTTPQWLPIAVTEGQPFTDAFIRARLPGESERMNHTSSAAIREGRSDYSQEFQCEMASGERRWLAENVHLEPLGSGRWHAVGVCTDITDRKQAEETLRESENRFRLFMDNSPAVTFIKDEQGRYLFI
ncbi:MAG: PAS domain-containing protein, partial [Armatimonadota bacterium]|nr:PAS domain-containing protein [Armatimonadota bacterium]